MNPDETLRTEACARSPFKNVRLHALQRLMEEDHPRLPHLLLDLLGDPEPEVQLDAIRVAGSRGCKETLPLLLELLHSAQEPLAIEAAVALGELGHYGDVAPPGEEPPSPLQPQAPSEPAMGEWTFYVLFLVLSAGLFLSGYLFRLQLEDTPPSPKASQSP